MKIKTSIALLFSALLIGYGAPQSETNAPDEHATETAATSIQELQLNNGEKWKVNEEMMPFIRTSEESLNAFGTAENTDFHALGLALKENNNKLISSCTMSGESHNELHKWLVPQIGLVTALVEAQTDVEADMIMADLKTSFETFNSHFE